MLRTAAVVELVVVAAVRMVGGSDMSVEVMAVICWWLRQEGTEARCFVLARLRFLPCYGAIE